MLRYYFDEDSGDSKLVRALLADGIDVAVPVESGLLQASDPEHLRFATSEGRVPVSSNLGDF